MACFSDGSAYSWGLNDEGQLGLGDCELRSSPCLIDSPLLEDLDIIQVGCCLLRRRRLLPATMLYVVIRICADYYLLGMQVSCGSRHTVLRTDSGTFVCGWNKHGQLLLGDRHSRQSPLKVVLPQDSEVVDIACGKWHTLFLGKTP